MSLQKCETFVRQTKMYIFVCHYKVQRHYKYKQKCTETLQRQTKMYRDISKTNKNVQFDITNQAKMYLTLQ